jgi:hypothetical protein
MVRIIGERLLFITNRRYLDRTGGGVQWCTREYLETLQEAGFDVLIHDYLPDRSLPSRLIRKLRPRPFHSIVPSSLVNEVAGKVLEQKIGWIAYNNTEVCTIAGRLRKLLPESKHLFLSHGAEITDELNAIILSPKSIPSYRHSPLWLGQSLLAQVAHRQAIDASICISAEDIQFERWFGARNMLFLPRQVPMHRLNWNPQIGVIGTVATLDHAPNRHGLEAIASCISSRDLQLRVVGGPERIGRFLESTYPCIHYCGRLSDHDLEIEAASWMGFINPIFCQARGASTKVATALGWGLPILSTPQGVRGYIWDESALPLSTTPSGLSDLAQTYAFADDPEQLRVRALSVAQRAPSLGQTADQLASFLMRLP